jgi:membrane protein DedA with SNARE-associated domain
MSNKKGQPFPFVIIAIVLGWTIFKQFDFENLKFEKPALTIVYVLTFLMSVYFLVKNVQEK